MMKCFKAFGQEFNDGAGNNCVNKINKDENKKGYTQIYIGNISSETSIDKIQKFLGDIKIITFKQQNKENYFALANLPNRLEAEKTVEMYNNKVFMGHKLVVRLDDKQNTNIKILSEMPELEDIDDDDILQCDILNNRSSNNKTNFTCTNSKKCCEYKINLQPDSKGVFSLSINRKDSCFKSKKDIREKLSQFGSVSDVYFSSDSVVVKIPSMKQILNISKALNEELDMCFGDNSLKRNPENSYAKIYIGNIAVKASRAQILKFLDVKFTSFQLVNQKKKVFALANLPNKLEAEKTVEMYNNKVFMGHKLVVRLDDKQNKKAENLSEMPKLEDIDDSASEDNLNNKSCNSKMNSAMPQLEDIEAKKKGFCTNIKTCFEDSLNIQPDSSGLFSLIINRKDTYLKSENIIKNIFTQYGSVSSVSFIDDKIVVKMPSKQQAINSFKSLAQELNMSIGNNSVDTNTVKKNQNKISGYAKIYIGNIAVKASRAQILKFFGDVNFISFRLVSHKNKVFSLANLPNKFEAEKTVEMYNNKVFMGHKLVVRLDDKQTANAFCQHNESASKRLVNDWISSQDNCLSNDNNHSTDFQNHVTLFIANFPVGTSKEQLLSLFQDFHPSNVIIINNSNQKRSTQALMNFPSQSESEKAIYKFDKESYEKNTLLVTSVGFCPCLDNRKYKRKYTVPTHNASGSQKKKQELLKCFPSAKHNHQQQEINCQLTNSLTHGITNQETFIKSPTNSLTNKNLDQHKQQMKEENQLIKISQFDDPFQAEAAKMAVLVKHFQIQPCLSSSSDTLQVMITSVINNELFWGNIFYSLSNDVTDFMVVHNEIQSTALSWPDYILSKKEMKCVALYQDEWYRAWVLNTVRNDAVKVFFLDYGNTSEIDLKYIRSPKESIWKLPPKARAFRIDSNSKKLTTNAENQIFDIKICKSGNMANGFISVASLICH